MPVVITVKIAEPGGNTARVAGKIMPGIGSCEGIWKPPQIQCVRMERKRRIEVLRIGQAEEPQSVAELVSGDGHEVWLGGIDAVIAVVVKLVFIHGAEFDLGVDAHRRIRVGRIKTGTQAECLGVRRLQSHIVVVAIPIDVHDRDRRGRKLFERVFLIGRPRVRKQRVADCHIGAGRARGAGAAENTAAETFKRDVDVDRDRIVE